VVNFKTDQGKAVNTNPKVKRLLHQRYLSQQSREEMEPEKEERGIWSSREAGTSPVASKQ